MAKNTSPYFSPDFVEFFKELAANNSKEWFDTNRKRYNKSVKEPFKIFVSDLIANIQKIDPSVQIEAKEAIFRINRDIRFSKDKSLYKLDRSANISPAGRKDYSVPGFYISLGPENVSLGGGAYFLKPDQLQRMREHIKNNLKRFEKLLADEKFRKYFDGIRGEESKRIPKELQDAAGNQPLLYKKQFYYMAQHRPELITSPDLMKTTMEHYKVAYNMKEFLAEGMDDV